MTKPVNVLPTEYPETEISVFSVSYSAIFRECVTSLFLSLRLKLWKVSLATSTLEILTLDGMRQNRVSKMSLVSRCSSSRLRWLQYSLKKSALHLCVSESPLRFSLFQLPSVSIVTGSSCFDSLRIAPTRRRHCFHLKAIGNRPKDFQSTTQPKSSHSMSCSFSFASLLSFSIDSYTSESINPSQYSSSLSIPKKS